MHHISLLAVATVLFIISLIAATRAKVHPVLYWTFSPILRYIIFPLFLW